VLKIIDLTKRYGHSTAVDSLSCEILPGRVTGFLGPNGAGKSTTLRTILGLATPTHGQAVIDGRPYRALRQPLHHVGALLDATAVPAGRSGYQHLAALARANGIRPARIGEVLEKVGLADAARKRIRGYSLGMKQRLGIAAALLGDPGVLIFDEPLNGLDPEGVRWIRDLFRRLATEGRTVFVSSHLMSEMQHTADHLIVIGRGRLIADTSMTDFVDRGSGRHITVRTPHPRQLAEQLTRNGAEITSREDGRLKITGLSADRVGDLALTYGIALHELTTHTATLEDVFMDLTAGNAAHQTHPGIASGKDA
jgi:ABC-2 type transport system ATP-binding protein